MTHSINFIPVVLFETLESSHASSDYKGFSYGKNLELFELARILKSLEHQTRCILVDVLSQQPQPLCVVFEKLNAAIKRRALHVRVFSFSSLSFHLSILERSNLARRKMIRKARSPKGYPIRAECYLTPLGLYVKANLSLFMQYAETIKRLSVNIKNCHDWEFDVVALLSIADACTTQVQKVEIHKLKSLCRNMNTYYYLRRMEERNRWMLINKAGRSKSIEISRMPEKMVSQIRNLCSLKTGIAPLRVQNAS